jgi:hypothetical protein
MTAAGRPYGRAVTDPGASRTPPAVPASVRAQILATERWSLLAARSTMWGEVMSRITVHLTVASAALVVLALVTQAQGFGTAFHVLSIGLSAAILLLGTLTWVRVHNASADDSALMAGMNRLRAAYLELDPQLEQYFVTGWHDDPAGVQQTYLMGNTRSAFSHAVGSTAMFMAIVNAIVAGTLGALIADAAGDGPALVSVVGTIVGVGYFLLTLDWVRRTLAPSRLTPSFPGAAR